MIIRVILLSLAAAGALLAQPTSRFDQPERADRWQHHADSDRAAARGQLLQQVRDAWQRGEASPQSRPPTTSAVDPGRSPRDADHALDAMALPALTFNGATLGAVLQTLGTVVAEVAGANAASGVDFVLVDPDDANPLVTLSLRPASLRRALDLVARASGFRYSFEAGLVTFRPGEHPDALETVFLPISRATVLRLSGQAAEISPPAAGAAPVPLRSEGQQLRSFLQLAGVPFDTVAGATLAFDGSQLIVTHTPLQLERVRNILRRYESLRQVEIEAKFMEVQEGALEELGVQWRVATRAEQQNAGARARYRTGDGTLRPLHEAFSFQGQSRTLDITVPGMPAGGEEGGPAVAGVSVSLPVAPPVIPGGVTLGAAGAALADVSGVVGEFDVNAIVRALQQRSGTELLSAPRLTVLSGNAATITVAQEMRYPQSYGQIQSQVGTGSINGGGSAGVSITSGTPQEFTTRNVGVELKVTPTVEEDDHSISLDLHPRVTELEGFVEYGGPSVAISGGTTVTVPPGFYQPIFAVREVTTRVTLWDGATLIMGGLTREDVKRVKDKVPVLGSIPLLGRLFRSEGESTQKRNLLIFVTARLVNPGGRAEKPKPQNRNETDP